MGSWVLSGGVCTKDDRKNTAISREFANYERRGRHLRRKLAECRSRIHKHTHAVGSRSFQPDHLLKVTEIKKKNFIFQHSLPLFQHTSHICELVTIDGTIYPSQHFPFGAAFVCQVGKFWSLLRISECVETEDRKTVLSFFFSRASSTNSLQVKGSRS